MENQLDGTIPPSCWPHHPMQNRQSAMRNFWIFGPKIDVNDWNVTISEVTIDVFFGVCLDSQWLWLDLGVQPLFCCWLVCPILLCSISFIIPMVSQYYLSSSNIVLWSWGNLSLIKRCQRSRGWKFSESKHLNLDWNLNCTIFSGVPDGL